jgi:DnaD/phage-associated family protein
MVNKKISNSQRVNDLPLGAQLLFTWLIPHLDCNGCFYGSAQMIKSLVVPRKSWPKSDIEKWLVLMEKSVDIESGLPLVQRYFVGKDQYLFMPGFVDEQIGLRRDKEKPDFPPFDGKLTEIVGQTVPLREVEVERKVEVEEEVKDDPPISPLSSDPENNENIKNFFPTTDQVIWFYQEQILLGGTVTEEMDKELHAACERYGPGLVNKAVKEAKRVNKPSWRYIMGILTNWQRDGKVPVRQ